MEDKVENKENQTPSEPVSQKIEEPNNIENPPKEDFPKTEMCQLIYYDFSVK